jgi:exodeoxyribonuclease VII small subunit
VAGAFATAARVSPPSFYLEFLQFSLRRRDRFALESPQELSVPKFEECLDRLEKIVDELDKGDVSLDRALELFDEGMKLSGSCRKELEDAEGKVEILLKRNGKLQPEPFESATQSGEPSGQVTGNPR